MGELIKNKVKQQSKEEYSYKRMLDYGWTPEQASGIVGNLKYESGLDTGKEGDIGYKGGSSFGVAQFRGDRLKNLQKRYGSNWKDLDNQLEFVNWELNNTHKSAGDKLRQARGVYNTGRVISDFYEVPQKKWNQNDDRQRAVYDLHRKYSGVQLTDEDRANFLTGTAQRAIDNYNAIQQSTLNPTTPTPQISNFDNPLEGVNFTENDSEAQTVKEDSSVEIARMELQQKQNEENLFNDLLKASQLQYIDQNQVEYHTQQEEPQQEYQNGGSIPINLNGVHAVGKQNVIVPSPNITMTNVSYPILGISQETGEHKLMMPQQDYFFKNTQNVLEIPQTRTKNKRFA